MRKTVFWIHLFLALIAGSIIALMSLTGAVLACEKQIIAWADPDVVVPANGTARSLETLTARAIALDPAFAAATVTISRDPSVPIAFVARDKRVFLDPYTGQSLGEGATTTRAVLRWITQLHRWLALGGETSRPIGKGVTGAANLIFVFVLVTGLFIWFPKRMTWANFKTVLFPRWRLRGKARDWNWHHAVGFWSLLPLLAMSVTGVVISYAWANSLLANVAGAPPTPPRAASTAPATAPAPMTTIAADPYAGFDRAVDAARNWSADWNRVSVRLPTSRDAAISVTVDAGTGAQPQHRTPLTIARDGTIRSAERFDELPLHRQARPIARFLHTGEILGLLGQLVFGLACVASVVLAWTGIALSWRRFIRKPGRRRRIAFVDPAASP